ncbi:MAG: TIGR04283 family arsenosugar biosynthesis glycosyltransferase [Gemmatimonadota bacterium]
MKVSVVIPALNEAETIAACIASAARQSGDLEILVVDGGSTDRTPERVPAPARVVTSECGRAAQMNAGARHTHGDVLLFLHADSRLHPAALAALREVLLDSSVVGGTFTLRFEGRSPLLGLYAFFTRFRFRWFHYGDQGIFVRRRVLEQLGGFRAVPILEDVDILRRLEKLGRRALVPLPVTTSARRFERRGALRQQLLNAAILLLRALGAPHAKLARWYPEMR